MIWARLALYPLTAGLSIASGLLPTAAGRLRGRCHVALWSERAPLSGRDGLGLRRLADEISQRQFCRR